jgi:PAS domain-containing protein
MLSTKPSSVLHPSDAQQQYEQLVASINGIVWEANPVTLQFIFVSQQAERLLGYPVAQWLTPDFWADHLHPDDRAWVLASCREAETQRRIPDDRR